MIAFLKKLMQKKVLAQAQSVRCQTKDSVHLLQSAMLASLYVVRCYVSCLPRLCSIMLHGEKKHKKFMNINEQLGTPNLKMFTVH